MYSYYKKKSLKPFLKVCPLPLIWKLAEQLADQLSGPDPQGWLQSIIHSIGSEIITLIIVLMVICILYQCLSTKIVQTKQTHLVRTFFNKVSTVTPNYEKIKKGGIVRGRSTLRKPICCTFLPLCAISQGFSVPYQFLFQERVELHAVLRTEIMGKGTCLDSFQ